MGTEKRPYMNDRPKMNDSFARDGTTETGPKSSQGRLDITAARISHTLDAFQTHDCAVRLRAETIIGNSP